jgi:hypothetical protein
MKNVYALCLLVLATLVGCSAIGAQEGSEEAARAWFSTEFDKWIAGEKNEAEDFTIAGLGVEPPLSYDFRSVVPAEPSVFVQKVGYPDDWKEWPAYKFSVTIEFKSQAGTPMEKVGIYNVTWNVVEEQWCAEVSF